jgi:hypothetical protein
MRAKELESTNRRISLTTGHFGSGRAFMLTISDLIFGIDRNGIVPINR